MEVDVEALEKSPMGVVSLKWVLRNLRSPVEGLLDGGGC